MSGFDLILHLRTTITERAEAKGMQRVEAVALANETVDNMLNAFQGEMIYIPKFHLKNVAIKHRRIYADKMAGKTTEELARKYNLAPNNIRIICRTLSRSDNPPHVFAKRNR